MQLYYKKMDWCLWFAIWDAWLYISNFRGSEINLQTFHRDVALTIPTPCNLRKWKTSFWIPRDNQIQHGKSKKRRIQNIIYEIFRKESDKYEKRYFSYIRKNQNYWLSVDVTKSRPFKKIRTLPREDLIPSIVVCICLAVTTFEIISS